MTPKTDMKIEDKVGITTEIRTGLSLDPDPSSQVSTNQDRSRCYRCNEYNHFARECPNDTSGRSSIDTEGSLLSMTDDKHLYALDYANRENFNGFKHVRDRNAATTSLSAHKKGGTFQIKHDHILTAKQAEFVYRELSTGTNKITTQKIMTQSIPEEPEPDNTYQKTLNTGCETDIRLNDKEKNPAQMKEWSILSDHVKYITSDKHETFNNLSIDQLKYRQDISLYRELQEKESPGTRLNFGDSSTKLRSEYLDVYEGI